MNINRGVYLFFALLGTAVPWLFFGRFIAQAGLDLPLFVQSLFINNPASGFSADIIISSVVFWLWAYSDAKTRRIRHWWLVIPAGLTVGLSMALPLYLYMRHKDEDT